MNYKLFKQIFTFLLACGLYFAAINSLKAQSQCNPDVTPPVPICINGLSVALDMTSSVTIWASDLNNGSFDNCSQYLIYSFSKDTSDKSLILTQQSPKEIYVTMWVTDNAGNQNSCLSKLELQKCDHDNIACNANIIISIEEGEALTLTPDVLLAGSQCSDVTYEIWLVDSKGDKLNPEINSLTESPIIFFIRDKISGNSCWGELDIDVKACGIASLACNDNVIVFVPRGDSVQLVADMFLEGGPYCPNSFYDVTLIDSNKIEYLNPYVSGSTQSEITYMVTDRKTGNSCWGSVQIKVVDCNQNLPNMTCSTEKEFICSLGDKPRITGFPLDTVLYNIVKNGAQTFYSVDNWDSCGGLVLRYIDDVTTYPCTGNYYKTINRTWILKNKFNRKDTCYQVLQFPYEADIDSSSVHNYDGVDLPLLDCKGNWPKLPNGSPDPLFTGQPNIFSCGYIAIAFNDLLFRGSCNSISKIVRTWTVINWCTAKTTYIHQIIKFTECGVDDVPPVAICDANVIVSLGVNGKAEVSARMFDDGSYDNCGIQNISFDKDGLQLFRVFTKSDIGRQNIQIFVTDYDGNQSSCFIQVDVVDKIGGGNPLIGGVLLDYDLNPINKNFNFTSSIKDRNQTDINSSICSNPPTNPNLKYSVCLEDRKYNFPLNLQLGIQSANSGGALNGVSTLDLVYGRKHLLGLQKLNPYQLFAADVDCSQSISVRDLFGLRSIILGRIQDFDKCTTPNLFLVPKDLSKLTSSFGMSINSIPDYQADFVVIKRGDISGDWNLKEDKKVKTRENSIVDMYIAEQSLVEGEQYDVWVDIENPLDFLAIQLGLNYDNSRVEILSLESPYIHIQRSDYAIHPDNVKLIFLDPALNISQIQKSWLKIAVKAKKNSTISEVFSLPNDFKSLYIKDDSEEYDIRLHIGQMVSTKDYSFDIKPNIYPNPFNQDINIQLMDEMNDEGTIELFDMNGSLIHGLIIPQNARTIHLDTEGLGIGTNGMYYLKIKIGNKIHVERIINAKN